MARVTPDDHDGEARSSGDRSAPKPVTSDAEDGQDPTIDRRSALKKAGVGAGVTVGLVWASPRIEGLTLRADYAAAASSPGSDLAVDPTDDVTADPLALVGPGPEHLRYGFGPVSGDAPLVAPVIAALDDVLSDNVPTTTTTTKATTTTTKATTTTAVKKTSTTAKATTTTTAPTTTTTTAPTTTTTTTTTAPTTTTTAPTTTTTTPGHTGFAIWRSTDCAATVDLTWDPSGGPTDVHRTDVAFTPPIAAYGINRRTTFQWATPKVPHRITFHFTC